MVNVCCIYAVYDFQVSCKIVHVPCGGEMATKSRELARHFETQGTPVMIGELRIVFVFLYLAVCSLGADRKW